MKSKIDRPDPQCSLVMGIVNVTPDSFSDGGQYFLPKRAIQRAFQMIDEGADVVDIGAESTRPGFTPLTWEEEWRRLEPVLDELAPNTTIPISVDTYHPEVAERAVASGVSMVNDISMCAHPNMIDCLKNRQVSYVLMHHRDIVNRDSSVSEFVQELAGVLDHLLDAGVEPEQIWVDPGVGFGKSQSQNLACIRNLEEFTALGYPVLLGTSRKRVIGNVLNLPVDQRLEGSLATAAYGVLKGASMLRVHDVKETVRMRRMLEAVHFVD